jgi:hypothetical protein
MAGLVPAIHVFSSIDATKTWMPGISPGMTISILVFGEERTTPDC